jgi:branched-chain amino acid transport system ATP-binding protein
MILRTVNLTGGYGKMVVVESINIEVNKGEVVTLFGPNGAGKTTILRTISGLLKPLRGQIMFMGRDITNTGALERVNMGIRYFPDRSSVFKSLTVYDNIRLVSDEVDLSRFPILQPLAKKKAGELSGGQYKLLTLAVAYHTKPKLLLLDEPSSGLSPKAKYDVALLLRAFKEEGLPILIAEQDAEFVLNVADRVYIIESGKISREVSKTSGGEIDFFKAIDI